MGSERVSHFCVSFFFFLCFFSPSVLGQEQMTAFFFFFVCVFFVFSPQCPRTRANDCNSLGRWGISLRPHLRRPRPELPGSQKVLHKILRWLLFHEDVRLFCLQLEASCLRLGLFTYSCVWEPFCLQLELLHLQFELVCLQREIASGQHLNGL